MKATRKISSLIFILLGFTPLLFTLFITIQKRNIFRKMEEKMETHSLQTVIIPESNVVWMDDHEIWVNNHMFDIRTKKLDRGIYTFTGMYDEEETKLVAKERGYGAGQQDQEKSNLLSHIFYYLLTIYYEQDNDAISLYAVTDYFIHPDTGTVSVFNPILTPPPRKGC